MALEEQVAELRAEIAALAQKVHTLDTFLKITMAANSDLVKRVAKDEDFIVSVSVLARHAVEHLEAKLADAPPSPEPKKPRDSQAGIEVA